MITVLDKTKEYDEVWDRVYAEFGFKPSCMYRGHSLKVTLPFEIQEPYIIYSIEDMSDDYDQFEELVRSCLVKCSNKVEWYALDWQHSAFRFNPQNKEEMKSVKIKDENFMGGEYFAYFPDFYPDGDYYFFIDTEFKNGYLSHPWRQEVWIFGITLIDEIKKIAGILNWKIIKDI